MGVNDYKSGYLTFTFVILCHFDEKSRVLGEYQKRNEKYRSFLGCKLSFLIVLVLLFEKCNTTGIVAQNCPFESAITIVFSKWMG